jgi:hypothetical protein
MERIVVCYSFTDMTLRERNAFRRELFGSTEYSKEGKYVSEFIGVLSGKTYEKPVRSVLVIAQSELETVLDVLKKYRAIVKLYTLA